MGSGEPGGVPGWGGASPGGMGGHGDGELAMVLFGSVSVDLGERDTKAVKDFTDSRRVEISALMRATSEDRTSSLESARDDEEEKVEGGEEEEGLRIFSISS